jgi:hypothetical protein
MSWLTEPRSLAVVVEVQDYAREVLDAPVKLGLVPVVTAAYAGINVSLNNGCAWPPGHHLLLHARVPFVKGILDYLQPIRMGFQGRYALYEPVDRPVQPFQFLGRHLARAPFAPRRNLSIQRLHRSPHVACEVLTEIYEVSLPSHLTAPTVANSGHYDGLKLVNTHPGSTPTTARVSECAAAWDAPVNAGTTPSPRASSRR